MTHLQIFQMVFDLLCSFGIIFVIKLRFLKLTSKYMSRFTNGRLIFYIDRSLPSDMSALNDEADTESNFLFRRKAILLEMDRSNEFKKFVVFLNDNEQTAIFGRLRIYIDR